MIMIYIAYKHKVNNAGILTFGVVIDQMSLIPIAKPSHKIINDIINTYDFSDHRFEFRKQGVFLIGHILDLTTVFLTFHPVGKNLSIEPWTRNRSVLFPSNYLFLEIDLILESF